MWSRAAPSPSSGLGAVYYRAAAVLPVEVAVEEEVASPHAP